jgi:hypothetical protein
MMNLEKALRSTVQLDKFKKDVAKSVPTITEREQHKKEIQEEKKEKYEQFKREELMKETASFSDSAHIAEHVRGVKTRSGDGLPKGPRGGSFGGGKGLKKIR